MAQMANKTIKMTLSHNSIQDAIKQLREYQNGLKRKNEIFIKRLSEIGLDVIRSTMESIPEEEKGDYYTEVINDTKGEIIGISIRLSGTDVLFVEFSAGISYGTDSYPLPSGDEYGMGTYPGKGNWDNPNGWWYKDENGKLHHSFGNRAYMPMYHAEEAIIISVREIAKEVFG
jgi:hypothetical protein